MNRITDRLTIFIAGAFMGVVAFLTPPENPEPLEGLGDALGMMMVMGFIFLGVRSAIVGLKKFWEENL